MIKDALFLHTIDVKKGPYGYEIIEVGESACGRNHTMIYDMAARLLDSTYNPLDRPIIIIENKDALPYVKTLLHTYRGMIKVQDRLKEETTEEKAGIDTANFSNYNGIIIKNINERPCFPANESTNLVANDPIFWEVGRSKVFANAYLPENAKPHTRYFENEEELATHAKEFLGKSLFLKPDRLACSNGITYIKHATLDTIIEAYRYLDMDYGNYFSMGLPYEFVREFVKPRLIQEAVPDVFIETEEGEKGVSVDRLLVIGKFDQGRLHVDYAGGFHRLRTTNDPIFCTTRKNAVHKKISKKEEEQIKEEVLPELRLFYENIARLPKDFVRKKKTTTMLMKKYPKRNI